MGGPKMYAVGPLDSRYNIYKDAFLENWDRANRNDPRPRVRDLWLVNEGDLPRTHRGQRFQAYCDRRGGNWRSGFHGSVRECHIGNWQLGVKNSHLVCCDSPRCGICGIIRQSFKIDRSKAGGLFGKGIYVTECSLKANTFAHNIGGQTDMHMVLLIRYVPGKIQYMQRPCNGRLAPDPGFDSVEALLHPYGPVNLPEAVVYREDAIVPIGVITYCVGHDTDDRPVPSAGPSRILSPTRPPNPGRARRPSRRRNPPSPPGSRIRSPSPNSPSRSPSSRSRSPPTPPIRSPSPG